MNEATFEATVNSIILKIFPFIRPSQITHQTRFTLKLGHQETFIDGRNSKIKLGISDIIIKIKNKPTILFELKGPDQIIKNEDFDQAISYARLSKILIP